MSYTIGNSIRVSIDFRDPAGVYVDPTAVEVRIRKPAPSAETAVLAAVRDDLGRFHADVLVDRAGIWAYRAVASGAVVAAVEGTFEVAPSVSDFTTQ